MAYISTFATNWLQVAERRRTRLNFRFQGKDFWLFSIYTSFGGNTSRVLPRAGTVRLYLLVIYTN